MKGSVAILSFAVVSTGAFAQSFSEGFEDITTLAGDGWNMQNLSSSAGLTNWFQGNAAVFTAHQGADDDYIGANFNNVGAVANSTISNWLLTPTVTLNNGDELSFFTRVPTTPFAPDRLEVRLSTNGSSTNVGGNATSVGDFTTLLLSINPNLTTNGYPNTWTQFTVNVSGLGGPTDGRFAFRYFVTDGGPLGANSDYIGIDTLNYTAVPEPATMAALGLGAVALLRRRRK